MKKNSTIDNFLNEQLTDFNWLSDAAKEKKNYPGSDSLKHQKQHELAMQWTPQNLLNNEPDVRIEKKVAVVVNEAKRQLMMGKSLQHVKETIIDQLPPDVKTAAKGELVKLAQEYPLLGSVYIEPAAFGADAFACEKGASQLKNNSSRLAVYAKKMASCSGCSYNKGGFCRLYKKALVQEVPYTEKTLNHYQKHLAMSNKVASTTPITSKEELKQAFLGKNSESVREAASVVYHDESKKLTFNKAADYGKYQDKMERDIAADLSLKLASGMEPELFKAYVTERYAAAFKKYPDVFRKYSALVGSLGRVFIEFEPFKNAVEAKDFILKHAQKVPYILVDKNTRKLIASGNDVILGKKIISSLNEIPLDVWTSNLRGRAFNAAQLSSNPLAVTKAAFLAPRAKTASVPVDTIEIGQTDLIEQELTTPTYNKKATAPQSKTASSKLKPNKESNVKADGNKVRAMVDRNLEIEIEPFNYDDTISKYT